ncbi:heavy-metal-associated domain-containing protein [Niabella drilacis]|uniref:Copper chaperone CopZ n=1 Tax=Niabella drilacis (strain DSM 25811 / CCM 8410 / CCUG 62505 / LMG 26954 / E90) TaxID=1285928 RepID=A0A1G6L6L5_NIADE|nr:heavy-metal-associated domain-containing protein [Niabella drilacis]SDC38801.1 Copper chaperone CopZ [Niabella drilacis]
MKQLGTILLGIMLLMATGVQAQTKTEKISVSGNCGMCKKTIEKAAKTAGAKEAVWDIPTKELLVKYDAKKTSSNKIQNAVADAGYDTRDVKGRDAAYEKLHACCQYERTKTYTAVQQ